VDSILRPRSARKPGVPPHYQAHSQTRDSHASLGLARMSCRPPGAQKYTVTSSQKRKCATHHTRCQRRIKPRPQATCRKNRLDGRFFRYGGRQIYMQTEDEVAIKNLGQGHFCSKVIDTDRHRCTGQTALPEPLVGSHKFCPTIAATDVPAADSAFDSGSVKEHCYDSC